MPIIEKRQSIRIPSSRPIVMYFNHQTYYCVMTDFSQHGIGFMAAALPQRNERIEVHF